MALRSRRGTRESFCFIWLWSKSSRIPLHGASLVEELVRVSVSFGFGRNPHGFRYVALRSRRGTRQSFCFIWLWSKSSRIRYMALRSRRGTRESFCFIWLWSKSSRIPLHGASLVEELVRVSVSFDFGRNPHGFRYMALRSRRGTRQSFCFIWLWSKSSRIPLHGASLVEELVRVSVSFGFGRNPHGFRYMALRS